jgi:hypothetical protein
MTFDRVLVENGIKDNLTKQNLAKFDDSRSELVYQKKHQRNLSNISNVSNSNKRRRVTQRYQNAEAIEKTPFMQVFLTYLCYFVLEMFGHFREFLRKYGFEKRKGARDNNPLVI